MRNKEYLFLCSTEYAIFNSINAVLQNVGGCKGYADIAIFHRTKNTISISKRLREKKIFSEVYDFSFFGTNNTITLLMLLAFPKYFLNKVCFYGQSFCSKKNAYRVLVSQNYLFASLFLRIYRKATVFFIEDGLSSYTGRTVEPKRRSSSFTLANKIIFKGALEVQKQLLYKPEMYTGSAYCIEELQIPETKNKNFFNLIFGYKDNTLYKVHKFVYLGTPYYGLKDLMINSDDARDNLEYRSRHIVDTMLKGTKENRFIYREHPLESVDKDCYKELCEFDLYNNVWEIECQNTITNQHILVSFFSTALFSPKILYGKEPYLIFLYKILGIELFKANELISSLKSAYINPEKIILVKNIDELSVVIEKLDSLQEFNDFRQANKSESVR